jgi:uncharacterized membrane protein
MSSSRHRRDIVTPRRLVVAVLLLATVWTAGIFVVPWLVGATGAETGFLRLLYQPVCHQLAERSLQVAGESTAVCSRCTGLYLGGALGLLVMAVTMTPLRGSRLTWLLAASAPTLIDVGARVAGLPGLPDVPRLLVALPAGAVLGMLLGEALSDLGDRAREPLSGRPVELSDTTANGMGWVSRARPGGNR